MGHMSEAISFWIWSIQNLIMAPFSLWILLLSTVAVVAAENFPLLNTVGETRRALQERGRHPDVAFSFVDDGISVPVDPSSDSFEVAGRRRVCYADTIYNFEQFQMGTIGMKSTSWTQLTDDPFGAYDGSFTAMLPPGDIRFAGTFVNDGDPFDLAIQGGTGAYAGNLGVGILYVQVVGTLPNGFPVLGYLVEVFFG